MISTDRHLLQGAIELEDVSRNARTRTLDGVSLGPQGTAHNVTVYVPEAQGWMQGGPFLFRDFPDYTVKMMDEHLLRIRVRFRRAARVAWRLDLGRLLKRQEAENPRGLEPGQENVLSFFALPGTAARVRRGAYARIGNAPHLLTLGTLAIIMRVCRSR